MLHVDLEAPTRSRHQVEVDLRAKGVVACGVELYQLVVGQPKLVHKELWGVVTAHHVGWVRCGVEDQANLHLGDATPDVCPLPEEGLLCFWADRPVQERVLGMHIRRLHLLHQTTLGTHDAARLLMLQLDAEYHVLPLLELCLGDGCIDVLGNRREVVRVIVECELRERNLLRWPRGCPDPEFSLHRVARLEYVSVLGDLLLGLRVDVFELWIQDRPECVRDHD
mmetsp:Transcript_10276/g.23158  ORF Transcript_10276/g.23158 Transcript_10276/m.23158 type:complete len:224 (-) Transcript_10276:187-858(-)